MSYDDEEYSASRGRPYFLYQFANSAGFTYLTSELYPLEREDSNSVLQTWEPDSITHDEIKVTGNVEKNDLNLVFPITSPFARTLLLTATSIMTLTVFRGHYSDPTLELRPVWKGKIVGAKSSGESITVVSESIYTSLRRTGCTARVQRTCRHALYLPGCNVDKSLFAVPAVITALSGLTLTVPIAASYPNGRFKAGMFEFQGNWGFVNHHVGSTIKLTSEIVGLEDWMDANSNASIILYPGCDRSENICHTVFNNILNHGGFSRRPKKNPFSGSII